ncbi:hypothetical protein BC829DRAFT_342662, partial [Chytridium lagenaria]
NPLTMVVLGPGGTGKSHLINALTQIHNSLKADPTLQRAAYTGSASANIEGETLHHLYEWSVNKQTTALKNALDTVNRERLWSTLNTLIVDEIGMI